MTKPSQITVGTIALCGAGHLGIITGIPKEKEKPYTGIHITYGKDKWPGAHWQSKDPKVMGHCDELFALLCTAKFSALAKENSAALDGLISYRLGYFLIS